tara:strand:+ start:28 stop:1284 length:1257 start_codon:yes stop_codon:yes gene_type:complete
MKLVTITFILSIICCIIITSTFITYKNIDLCLLIIYLIFTKIFKRKKNLKFIANKIKKICISLGPIGVKFGQVISNRTDIIGKELGDLLSELRDDVPGLNLKEEKKLLEKVRQKVNYKLISPGNIGAGCIAITYIAMLEDNREVIIKIKRPNIERKLNNSFNLINKIISLINNIWLFKDLDLKNRFNELEKVFKTQVDFKEELKELTWFYNKYKDGDNLIIPEPYPELSNEDVITMEYIKGKKISELNDNEKEKLCKPFINFLMSSMFQYGNYHCDLHTGNMIAVDNKLCIIDFGLTCKFNELDRVTAYSYYLTLLNKDWDSAIKIIESRLCKDKPKKIKTFRKSVEEILTKYFVEKKVWDPTSYLDELTKCMKKHGTTMVYTFVDWELAMITVQGAIEQLCSKNIWDVCRENLINSV